MISIKVETIVQSPFDIVTNNFSEDLFQALAPAFPPSRLVSFDGDRVGGLVKIELGLKPLSQLWISEIVSRSEDEGSLEFVDQGIQLPFPLKTWSHRHIVRKLSNNETIIIDDIECSSGSRLLDSVMRPVLYSMFEKRTPVYQRYFADLRKKGDLSAAE